MDEKDEKPPTQWIRPQGIESTSQVGFHGLSQDEPEEKDE